MSEQPVRLYPKMPDLLEGFSSKPHAEQTSPAGVGDKAGNSVGNDATRLEPSTCVEAETFALRVLDDSMQPEFRKGCIILIDPTGRATVGSYVLAMTEPESTNGQSDEGNSGGVDGSVADNSEQVLKQYLFRQLRQDANDRWFLQPLNDKYQNDTVEITLKDIAGVIVQRAGTRRSYHKHYD